MRVELIQVDETDVGALAGLQFAVEACAGVADEYRVLVGLCSFRGHPGPGGY